MRNALLMLFTLCVFWACEDTESTTADDCPSDIICTKIFVSLILEPLENGKPVMLTTYEIVNLRTDEVYDFELLSNTFEEGKYIGISDAQIDDIEKEGSELLLRGKQTNGEDYQLQFEVGHDCCHVVTISGPFVE